jgi:tripartite-type tricarboxylate transporter receptor subunit TctC
MMTAKFPRRDFLHLAVGATALPVLPHFARAQTYPSRPVRLIVPGAAGNTIDIIARLIGQWLSERLGKPFVIENRPGAGTNIGTEAVVRAPADGHTLLYIAAGNLISPSLYDRLTFNFPRDITPVAGLVSAPNVLVVNPSFPASTAPELISYAKANPGKINFASPGIGTSIHLSGELFKMMAGVSLVHVPYRGTAAALADLISGQVQAIFDNVPTSIEYIKAGTLRALAVTGATRSELLPNVPTMGEFLPGYEASAVNGIGAPKSTSSEIVAKLNREINAGLAEPRIKARVAELGFTVLALAPAEYGKLNAAEIDKWAKVVKFSGARAD